MDSIENSSIGVSYCEECQKNIPIIEKRFSLSTLLEKDVVGEIYVIYCPQCGDILNKHGDVKIKYYAIEDIPSITGWKLDEFEREQESPES